MQRNVSILIKGAATAQAIPLVISPILTRIYTPEDFGVFALFSAIVGFISITASARYEQAIMIPKYEKYTINILSLGVILAFITALLSFFILVLFKTSILTLLNNNLLGDWLYFIPVTVFFIAMFHLLTNYKNKKEEYKDIAQAAVIKSIVLSIVQIVIGVLQSGFAGLILAQVSAQAFANVTLANTILKNKTLFTLVSIKKMLVLAKKFKNFPKYNLPHALIGNIVSNLPIYILTPFFGTVVVGHYTFAMMIAMTPMMIVSGATARVYNQKVARLYSDQEDVYAFTVDTVKKLLKKIIIPFALFVLIAPEFFSIIFGSGWKEAGIYVQLLSFYLILNVLVSAIAYIPNLKSLQRRAFTTAFLHFMVLFIVLYGVSSYYDVYIVLGTMSFINGAVLIYNFIWMTNALKIKK